MTTNQAPSEDVRKVAEQLGDWFDSRLGTNGVNYDRLLLQHKEAIATALQAERDQLEQEQGRWQEEIYKLLLKYAPDNKIDGAGCDSGDPLDFTITEIAQALIHLKDQLDEAAKVISPFARIAQWDAKRNSDQKYPAERLLQGFPDSMDRAGVNIGHCRAAADWLAKHKPV